jgi:transposase
MEGNCDRIAAMDSTTRTPCANCSRLEARLDALQAKYDTLFSEVVRLREDLAAARKDSSTSSKPPSSDIVKPKPAQEEGAKRSIGGQPGHPKHERQLFPAEQITLFKDHSLEVCPCCGGPVRRNADLVRIVQQVDIKQTPLSIEQHTFPEYWCTHCCKPVRAPMPSHIAQGGLVGKELTALIAFMKGVCHASFSTVQTFLRDVVGLPISRGELSNILGKVSAALEQPFEELLRLLPKEEVVNVDETGHRCNKERWWTWCFRAELYTLYRIDAHRSAEVLMDTLGEEFRGVLGCDYFSAYRRYMRECDIRIQFCLAHLIRDVKFLTTLPDPRDCSYGEALRAALKKLFEVFHQRKMMKESEFQRRLKETRDNILRIGLSAPPTRHGQNMAKRFRKHGDAYFTFVTTPGVEPTNNLAEQAIRFVVIDRHITQGTRSERGRQWSERIWTVIATCVQNGKSVHDFLREAVTSWFEGTAAPSLLPEKA